MGLKPTKGIVTVSSIAPNRGQEEVAAVLFCFAYSCSGSSGISGGGTGSDTDGTAEEREPKKTFWRKMFGKKVRQESSALGQSKNF